MEFADYYMWMISPETKKILTKARNILSFHESKGLSGIPATAAIEKFLARQMVEPARKLPAPSSPNNVQRNSQAGSLFCPIPETSLSEPLAEIYQDMKDCRQCSLHHDRKQIIPGCGPAGAKLFIIEDQPTAAEEEMGYPFAKEAGDLFAKMLEAIGMNRAEVYITSIVKCRPLADRIPKTAEIRTCLTYLARQIAAINPRIICTMGPLAAKVLTGNDQPLTRYRGKIHDFHGIPLIPSFHPRFLLKNQEMKAGSWADLQLLQKKIS